MDWTPNRAEPRFLKARCYLENDENEIIKGNASVSCVALLQAAGREAAVFVPFHPKHPPTHVPLSGSLLCVDLPLPILFCLSPGVTPQTSLININTQGGLIYYAERS